MALAVVNAFAFLVLAGQPNPGMAAVSVFPLMTAVLLWRRARIAPYATMAVAALTVFFHPTDVALDLARPGDVLPARLREVEALGGAAAVQRRRIVFGGHGNDRFTLDGEVLDHHRVDLRARQGTVEVWEVVNEHTTDHPFHLHSYSFQVPARDGRPGPVRAARSTTATSPPTRTWG